MAAQKASHVFGISGLRQVSFEIILDFVRLPITNESVNSIKDLRQLSLCIPFKKRQGLNVRNSDTSTKPNQTKTYQNANSLRNHSYKR